MSSLALLEAPAASRPRLMTTEEMLALPENGTTRWLIEGVLREIPVTLRNRWHSRVELRGGALLDRWLDLQPEPRGELFSGEVGVRLKKDPDLTLGIDIVYVSAELAAKVPVGTRLIEGIPTLAVEILSPSDTIEAIEEKVDLLLSAGVPLVWVINPHNKTVAVYRPGQRVVVLNDSQELIGDPELPGFRVLVAKIFSR